MIRRIVPLSRDAQLLGDIHVPLGVSNTTLRDAPDRILIALPGRAAERTGHGRAL